MMTKEQMQAAFDKIYRGLRAQNFERSVSSPNGMCRYRDDVGRKCAVGQLISDEEYATHTKIEGMGVSYLMSHELEGIKGVSFEFLSDIQQVHDQSLDSHTMKRRLEYFASERYLTVPK